METTTDRAMIRVELRVAIAVIIGLLAISNTATLLMTQQEANTEDIKYNYDRGNRKIENMYEKVSLETELKLKDIKIKELEEKLKKYENN